LTFRSFLLYPHANGRQDHELGYNGIFPNPFLLVINYNLPVSLEVL